MKKVELTKKELRAIADCVVIAEGTLTGKPLFAPMEAVRRLGKINLNELWIKLNHELNN
ncbi:unnamed protein product [marine sediment metagenome]|uniref:Uncharacterized protein n=1 Tax=marine sediment metagenome TaxID=412755 RepID=X1VHL6_9ZZZZ